MWLYHRWIDRNLTRLELVTSLMVILIFFGLFVRHSLIAIAMSERTSLNYTISNINSSLSIMAAKCLLLNNTTCLAAMQGMNPMGNLTYSQAELLYLGKSKDVVTGEFKMAPPPNYIGVRFQPDPSDLEAGIWYFDLADNTLVYTVKNNEYFSSDTPGIAAVKFQVILDYQDKNENNIFDLPADEFTAIKLKNLNSYHWNL